jgi:acyl-CoA synthetase (AMP-forming)/AMP-acid ligase II
MPTNRFPRGSDVPFLCLPHLLNHQSQCIPDAPAILGASQVPLTYGRLYRHIEETGRTLRAKGIGRRDRIAILLPNGPEMAVAILAVAATAICVPMNPAYRSEELCRYFAALRPRAVITQARIDSPARRAALDLGVRTIELSTGRDPEAGLFTLTGEQASACPDAPVCASDVALLLLTSGTTSTPKIVPLTHASICTSAYNSVSALALRQIDCGLNMMPLFHGHGLNNNLLASLAAGASIACAPGCEVNNFFAWLRAFQPTWYSAVPTMHQAILAQARRNNERAADYRLRFIRSASAPLSPRILAELEQTFETCVIESYGMTETASSYVACNPLPPRQRKPGSVGLPVGLDVAIMDERGDLLPGGETGQVVVRGPSVMAGYDGDQAATQAAFASGWFKTGDLGYFDDDGYLFLAGRVREMINRGGEKIAPQEVDDVLLQHPAVAEAVTFTVPHATLGEDVASAVVLRSGDMATPKEIRQFASGRIADFKVPRQVLIVREIPKSATGKTQRVGLADKLGLAASAAPPRSFVAPRTPLERSLAEHWAEILQIAQIGLHDNFFAAGGDSLLATEVLHHIHEITQVDLPVSHFFEAPTVAEVARELERLIEAGQAPRTSSAITGLPRKNGVMPASSAQERLWRLQHALADLPFFNVLYALRLTSPCDAAVLERSINEIVRRHEILRTTLAVIDGQYVQIIAPQLIVPLAIDDLREPLGSITQNVGHQIIQEEMLHSFDLSKGPLIRTRLLRLAEQEHLLLISVHQVVCDGWSLGVLVEELVTLYAGHSAQRESPLPQLSYQYADFAHWQRHWKSHAEIAAQLAYWREQLREPLPMIQLSKPGRRRTSGDLLTARRRRTLPASLVGVVKRFSQEQRGTLFMALVAALKILLHRYVGEDDLRVATNVANRNRPGTEALIGPLANTVILRTNLGGDPSPQEVLRRVRATTLAAFDHQDLPFEELADALGRERAINPASLAKVLILLQNATLRPPAKFEGTLACEEANPNMILPLVTTTTYDVILALVESGSGLVGTCIYKPSLFSAREIDRLLQDFECVIEQMVAQPERPISAFVSLK